MKLRILKILNFLNLLIYILIAFNKTTIRITDSCLDYADLLYCLFGDFKLCLTLYFSVMLLQDSVTATDVAIFGDWDLSFTNIDSF